MEKVEECGELSNVDHTKNEESKSEESPTNRCATPTKTKGKLLILNYK